MFVSTSKNASRVGRKTTYNGITALRFSKSSGKVNGEIDKNHKTLIIITSNLVNAANITKDDYLDLEIDSDNNLARLIRVQGAGWKVAAKSKSGNLTIRYTNPPETLRIKTANDHEFLENIIDVKDGEIIFELDSRFNRDRSPLKFFRTFPQEA